MQDDSFTSHPLLVNSTRAAFESKLAKSSRSTDFRIPLSLCTMFNVMVDAKDQSAKLCAMEMGQEVIGKTSDCCDRQKLDLYWYFHIILRSPRNLIHFLGFKNIMQMFVRILSKKILRKIITPPLFTISCLVKDIILFHFSRMHVLIGKSVYFNGIQV